MFLRNKYYYKYLHLLISADNSIGEIHHIIPRSMKGDNSDDNRILLSYRQHLLAHHLLTKCVEKEYKHKMSCAYFLMRTGGKRKVKKIPLNRKEYEQWRLANSDRMRKNNPMKNEKSLQKMLKTRKKTTNHGKGVSKSKEFCENLSIRMKENNPMKKRKSSPKSKEVCESRSNRMKGNNYASGKKTEEHKRKIAESHIGIGHTKETKEKLSGIVKDQHRLMRVCSIKNKKEYATATFLSLIVRGCNV